jgi:uncharacterized membrane protein YtjA (UPF0391 family)
MFYWSTIFLLIAGVSAFVGMSGLAGISGQEAWGLFLASVMLAVLSLLLSRKPDSASPRGGLRRDPRRNPQDV